MPADILLSARQLLTGRAKKPTPSSASKDIIPLEDWENPPRDNKPIARWWWPGGSVDKETCERHLRFLKETGFGSVEVQPFLLGLDQNDLRADDQLRTVGEPSFVDKLVHCAKYANEIGMALDVTMGSGWPGGHNKVTKADAEKQLLMEKVVSQVSGPAKLNVDLPPAPKNSYTKIVQGVLDALGPPDEEGVTLVAVVAVQLASTSEKRSSRSSSRVSVRSAPDDETDSSLCKHLSYKQGVSDLNLFHTSEGLKGDGYCHHAPAIRESIDITECVRERDSGGKHGRGRLEWDVPDGTWRVLCFYSNATMHIVVGGAFPGQKDEALVVDHLTRRGADQMLNYFGKTVLDAAGGCVRGFFVDSFEMIGELAYTDEFLAIFKERLGYDLVPHLPLLFKSGGESKYSDMVDFLGQYGYPLYNSLDPARKVRVREDFEALRASLFQDDFIQGFSDWSSKAGVEFRLQAHGGYGNFIDTFCQADIPETEDLFGAGSTDFLKLAGSARNLMGRKFAGNESFIKVRFQGTRLKMPELRMVAGRAFLSGINRLTFHGVPYPYTCTDNREWYPFSGQLPQLDKRKGRILAGPLPMSTQFNEKCLKSPGMADFLRFLGRMGVATSVGRPVTDVAWLMIMRDVKDAADVQIGRIAANKCESLVTKAFRQRALTYDRVSPKLLTAATALPGGRVQIAQCSYAAILIDPMEAAEPEMMATLVELASRGVPILALGDLPSRAVGYSDHKARDLRVAESSRRLQKHIDTMEATHLEAGHGGCSFVCGSPFSKGRRKRTTVDEIASLLGRHVKCSFIEPSKDVLGKPFAASIMQRATEDGDALYLFNEAWRPRTVSMRFVVDGGCLVKWNPSTGSRELLAESVTAGHVLHLRFAVAEVIVLTLERTSTQMAHPAPVRPMSQQCYAVSVSKPGNLSPVLHSWAPSFISAAKSQPGNLYC